MNEGVLPAGVILKPPKQPQSCRPGKPAGCYCRADAASRNAHPEFRGSDSRSMISSMREASVARTA
jgi:hypothetical protein